MGGIVTPSHNGVLFIDEMAEFAASTLQALRQPLESGRVTITRSGGSVGYPSRFTLVAATNPCPCGWAGDARRACRCTPAVIDSYQRKLSGPLLDRIDLKVTVRRVAPALLANEPLGEPSARVRDRVVAARALQVDRQGCLNAMLKAARLRRQAELEPASRLTLERWAEQQGLSARGFHRAWRVARTAADLDGSERIQERHVLEALGYRLQDLAA
jgi:magnesium chelatase family protein